MERKVGVKTGSKSRGSKNYQDVDIYPTRFELLNERAYVLRKNIVRGKFPSAEYYLDIQFHLLREDFVSSVRDGIRSIQSNKGTTSIDIYKNVKIEHRTDPFGNISCTIEHKDLQSACNDEDSKKFMIGSLLVFTKDNFKSISFLGKVINRDEDDLLLNQLTIKLIRTKESEIKLSSYTMGECRTFFEPYFRVLKVLKSMLPEEFPMERYILRVDSSSQNCPQYLIKAKVHVATYINTNKKSELNKEQGEAFIAALTQEFVVIQGPPGTGKTHVGLKIAEALIKNYHLWYKKSPMLVISHKNHALDQFLEGLIEITDRLVRVGGQSKSDLLQSYTLKAAKQKQKDLVSSFSQMRIKDAKILGEALIVAMTTTAAARMKETLEEMRCPIVIVEEAAEVLESHVVAALTTHCQQLILLGDHQQLRPNTADHVIGKQYHLETSLFERMVNNGIHCYQLKVQHRMRPEFSELLKRTIYPFLRDHPSVIVRPSISGVEKNLYFIDHKFPEGDAGTSKSNDHEAEFVIRLAGYLVCGLHSSKTISILSMYSGQVDLINAKIQKSKYKEVIEGVKVSTLDAFQGQESEIVLLSLVRSKHVGFLSAENRICVALSRARNGLYIIGNMQLLSGHSDVWTTIRNLLVKNDHLGDSLTLYCQNHPETKTKVRVPEDFNGVSLGGCSRKCRFLLDCGHYCRLHCHPYDKKHEVYQCKQLCNRRCKKNPEHNYICKKLCFEKCDPCRHKVPKKFKCGHVVRTECSRKTCPHEEHCNSDDTDE